MIAEQKSFFRKLLDKYNRLCEDLGVEQGACRGCVPVIKFDPEKKVEEKSADNETK